MFGKNEIVGQKYFKDVPEDTLFVTSMFFTLQGEGVFAGKPAFFIRLAKCNLACSFCDTFFDDGDYLTFDEIEQEIEKILDQHWKNLDIDNPTRPRWTRHGPTMGIKKKMVLVLTGGEPLLQKNIGRFLKRMEAIFQNTQIESNGIVHQPDIPLNTTLIISPKCLEKDGKPWRYIKPNLKNLERADALKFVMSADRTSPYGEVPGWVDEWTHLQPNRKVYISPMNVYNDIPAKSKTLRNSGSNRIEMEERSTVDEVISFWDPGLLNMEENQKNHEYAAKYCLRHGHNLNLQMHLYASLA